MSESYSFNRRAYLLFKTLSSLSPVGLKKKYADKVRGILKSQFIWGFEKDS